MPAPTVCLTFDFDAMSLWLGRAFGLDTPTAMSRGEFGGRVGVPRILRLLERAGIAATFYIPGHTLDSFPDLCREIRDAGHEVGHHGYLHESPVSLTEPEERAVLERGLDAIDRVLDERPAGYRSPAWDLSPHSIDLLLEFGFEYDSSMMAEDFLPYRVRQGDVPHRVRGYEWGTETELVEVPVSWTLDDFPQMEFNLNPFLPGLSGYDKTLAMWRADFDYMVREVPGGVFTITFHPQVIGRGARMTILEDLVAYMKQAGAAFSTVRDVVSAWTAANPLPARAT